ncbi:hypothetical protein EDB89DRAFT_1910858 [Lactarius sanguifluus]|nr:hypothetical protein EDB89DRAFT_1910858 [Lactarius sanguifluus]
MLAVVTSVVVVVVEVIIIFVVVVVAIVVVAVAAIFIVVIVTAIFVVVIVTAIFVIVIFVVVIVVIVIGLLAGTIVEALEVPVLPLGLKQIMGQLWKLPNCCRSSSSLAAGVVAIVEVPVSLSPSSIIRQAWEATFLAISDVCIVKPCCQQQQQQRPTSHVDFASYNYDTSSGDDATTTTRDGVCQQRATQHIDHLDGIRQGDVNHSKNNNDSNIINDSDVRHNMRDNNRIIAMTRMGTQSTAAARIVITTCSTIAAGTENRKVGGWNRFQLPITGRTTDNNQLVAIWLSVVQWR